MIALHPVAAKRQKQKVEEYNSLRARVKAERARREQEEKQRNIIILDENDEIAKTLKDVSDNNECCRCEDPKCLAMAVLCILILMIAIYFSICGTTGTAWLVLFTSLYCSGSFVLHYFLRDYSLTPERLNDLYIKRHHTREPYHNEIIQNFKIVQDHVNSEKSVFCEFLFFIVALAVVFVYFGVLTSSHSSLGSLNRNDIGCIVCITICLAVTDMVLFYYVLLFNKYFKAFSDAFIWMILNNMNEEKFLGEEAWGAPNHKDKSKYEELQFAKQLEFVFLVKIELGSDGIYATLLAKFRLFQRVLLWSIICQLLHLAATVISYISYCSDDVSAHQRNGRFLVFSLVSSHFIVSFLMFAICVYSIVRNLRNVKNIVGNSTYTEIGIYSLENQALIKAVGKTISFYGWHVDILTLVGVAVFCFCVLVVSHKILQTIVFCGTVEYLTLS